jgi:hypothetical protein
MSRQTMWRPEIHCDPNAANIPAVIEKGEHE